MLTECSGRKRIWLSADIAVRTETGQHIPVLAEALAERVILPQDAVMVDATVGHGGHSLLFGQKLGADAIIIGLDVDEKSISRARAELKKLACRVVLLRSNFSEITQCIKAVGIEKVDFIIADLGLCSAQIDNADIGLSFRQDMPLDMRIDRRLKTTAADIVNNQSSKQLADLIYNFGQDRAARRIARFIIERRKKKPIETTKQLASIVAGAIGPKGRKLRIHPATRTFQALRIAVNNELENLKILLVDAPRLLKAKGRIAVISFHSLEDRMVKWNFKENNKIGAYEIITRKPVTASKQEIADNRRARSAKLRIAEKL